MADGYLKTVLTPSAREAEILYYGKEYPSFSSTTGKDLLRTEEITFIESRDSFYLATVTEDGWPYIQHRGGPKGFLRVTDKDNNRIGFADYRGNRQMISVGNAATNDRISLFLMDYPRRQRLKILGHVAVIDARERPEMNEIMAPPGGHGSVPERYFIIDVISYDWNCPKFITPRYTMEEVRDLSGLAT